MLRWKLHTKVLSRLMAGLFAVQLIGAGFCLLTPEAHAMPAAHSMDQGMQMAAEDEHCAQPAEQSEKHGASCAHCLQPDISVQKHATPDQIDLVLLPDFLAHKKILTETIHAVSLSPRTPTGPPRSSTLIYDITQRIRV